MNDKHSITPPPELVEDWIELAKPLPQRPPNPNALAALAARWGADKELLACGDYLENCAAWEPEDVIELLNHRRPRPPSLKEQALAVLENEPEADDMKELVVFDVDQVKLIRKALEQFDD